MSRPRKYTPNTLKKAVNGYFDSISRLVPLTEKRNTGRKDSDGHVIYEEVPVLNRLGVQATVLEYLVPPTVGGLCEHLGIHRSTWADYCDAQLHPEFSDTTTHARGRMRAWLEEQLLTRKDVKGIVFDLQNNYGYYPLLASRGKRRLFRTLTKGNGLFSWDALAWADGTKFFYGGIERGSVEDSEKTFCALGAYLIISPMTRAARSPRLSSGRLSAWIILSALSRCAESTARSLTRGEVRRRP